MIGAQAAIQLLVIGIIIVFAVLLDVVVRSGSFVKNSKKAKIVKRENGFCSVFEGKGYALMETQYGEGDAAKSQTIAENYITQDVVDIFGCNEGSATGNAIKASSKSNIIGVGFDKSDAIMNLIIDVFLLCTMAQNPDVMGEEGVKAAVAYLGGQSMGGAVTDTGVSVITKWF